MYGKTEEVLSILNGEPGRKFVFVMRDELLQKILSCRQNTVRVLMTLGKTLNWIDERQKDGTKHRLVVFPASASTLATWENVFELVKAHYPDDLYSRLKPHFEGLKEKSIEEIDPKNDLEKVAILPREIRFSRKDFYSVEKILSMSVEDITLYDARGFFSHSIGCNKLYTGTGKSPTGEEEFLTLNLPIDQITGANVHDIQVDDGDLADEKRKQAKQAKQAKTEGGDKDKSKSKTGFATCTCNVL